MLENKVALVTGGGSGFGAGIARAFAAAGAGVAVADIRAGTAREVAAEIGGVGLEADVSQGASVDAMLRAAEAALGPLDILVNNAGVNRDVMFHKMDRDDWDAVMRVDLDSMFNVTRHVIEGMRARGFGRIVNISSVNAARGQAGQSNYCAAKAGVEGFTRALARESAGKGTTVNAVAPGYADTPMVEAVPDEIMEGILANVPLARLAEPGEIGRCVRFLASDDAGFITGATLPVNGGLQMG